MLPRYSCYWKFFSYVLFSYKIVTFSGIAVSWVLKKMKNKHEKRKRQGAGWTKWLTSRVLTIGRVICAHQRLKVETDFCVIDALLSDVAADWPQHWTVQWVTLRKFCLTHHPTHTYTHIHAHTFMDSHCTRLLKLTLIRLFQPRVSSLLSSVRKQRQWLQSYWVRVCVRVWPCFPQEVMTNRKGTTYTHFRRLTESGLSRSSDS